MCNEQVAQKGGLIEMDHYLVVDTDTDQQLMVWGIATRIHQWNTNNVRISANDKIPVL
jgi:hypothetical protein